MIKTIGLLIYFFIYLFIYLFVFISVAEADFNQIFTHLPFSQQEQQKVLQGELITIHVKESEEEELAVLMAFIAKTSVEKIKKHFIQGHWINLPEAIITSQQLENTTTIKDLSRLKFTSQDYSEINNFLSAQAGSNLNLNTAEIKRFQSIAVSELPTDEKGKAVETQIQQLLLSRFKAYKKGGINAIAPYIREQQKPYFLGQYFKRVSRFDSILQQYYPIFYQTLSHYPHNQSAPFQESFFALKMNVQNRPTYALMHRMLLQEGDAVAVSLRHFYASQSYNGEQDLGLFVPIKQGVLVLGLFRTSSDQVAGFGSSVKHAIGSHLFASSLTQYYEAVQQRLNTK